MISLVGGPVTPEQLRKSKDLFYMLRDQRSAEGNPYIRQTDSAELAVIVSRRAAENLNCQILLLTLFNALLRMGRMFSAPKIEIPNAELLIRPSGLKSADLLSAIMELSNKVDPHCTIGAYRCGAQAVISIGNNEKSGNHVIAGGVLNHRAVVSSADFESDEEFNPYASVAAAYAVLAEAYKEFFGSQLGKPRLANASLAYPIPKKCDIGRTLLVGAGGISHTFSWALQFCSVTGTMDVCDFEDIEPSNLNRYLCAFIDDVNARKDQQLATYIQSNSQLGATALGEKYEDLIKGNSISIMHYDRVASCVDNVVSRYAVQSDLPRLLVNAGTNAYSFQASRHDFLSGACLACLYPPRKGTSHEQRVACDQSPQGQTVRPMESYSMVTGLAGLYLLLQLLADRNWCPHHHGNALRLDSIIDEARKKDPECVLFCGEPQAQARFHEKLHSGHCRHSVKTA
jgi:ThiF family protein